jgi:hypothetical protein
MLQLNLPYNVLINIPKGRWKRGGRHGPGKLYKKDGTVVEQVWQEPAESNYAHKEPPKYPADQTPS